MKQSTARSIVIDEKYSDVDELVITVDEALKRLRFLQAQREPEGRALS